jgi:type VI secretion system protein ImpK
MSAGSSEKDELGRSLEPLFQLLVRIERERGGRADADKLYRQCCQEVESFQGRAKELELPPGDAENALYAIIALLDEIAVNDEGPIKEYWQPRLLQMRFFNENVAGDGFFDRLATLRGDSRRKNVLRVFYLCIMFGFRGKYRIRGSELELLEIEEGLRAELQRIKAIPKEVVLSPAGKRPYEKIADVRRNQLVFSIATISACVSVLLYIGLRLALSRDTVLLIERVTAALGA